MLSDVLRCFERGCRRGFGFGSVDVGSEETSCKKWSSGRSVILLDLVLVLVLE